MHSVAESNNDVLSMYDNDDIFSLTSDIELQDAQDENVDLKMDNQEDNESYELQPSSSESSQDEESFHSAKSEDEQVTSVHPAPEQPILSSHSQLEIQQMPPIDVIEIVSSDSSDSEDTSSKDPLSGDNDTSPPLTSPSDSNSLSPMMIASDVDESGPSEVLDERVAIPEENNSSCEMTDIVQDVTPTQNHELSDMEQDVSLVSPPTNEANVSSFTQPVINITGSNNHVMIVQGQQQSITIIPPSPTSNTNSQNPLNAQLVQEPCSEVQVQVEDITSIVEPSSSQPSSLAYSKPLLLTAPSAPPPAPSPPPIPSVADTVVQRRTSDRGGDDVMAINRHYRSNEIILDFADTKEIPLFLRNWNINKKRRFKPNASSNRPAKRQCRPGPDNLR
ncbi:hypothetical protein BD560DRAFT_429381 [Blakeslea trispora]|nr:hypothetical protein BD560DRAFT_429628 [Blakeslea trispora]KAI8328749.1 hypothetical protein BD560DRAFT_429381 [Blakeslea trispora]